mmetsp:Transcript_89194/g.144488  ORF Transcript_89194/g.144488 Transcript_89194/m.144488 type:complete len:247 (-) Transcript_89194:108-848(-)
MQFHSRPRQRPQMPQWLRPARTPHRLNKCLPLPLLTHGSHAAAQIQEYTVTRPLHSFQPHLLARCCVRHLGKMQGRPAEGQATHRRQYPCCSQASALLHRHLGDPLRPAYQLVFSAAALSACVSCLFPTAGGCPNFSKTALPTLLPGTSPRCRSRNFSLALPNFSSAYLRLAHPRPSSRRWAKGSFEVVGLGVPRRSCSPVELLSDPFLPSHYPRTLPCTHSDVFGRTQRCHQTTHAPRSICAPAP